MPRRAAKAVRSIPALRETALRLLQKESAAGSLEFKVELLAQIGAEIIPLLVKHHAEIERDNFPLDIDWDGWYRSNALGSLIVLTARSEGILVGYVFTRIYKSTLSKRATHAAVDGYWLDPVYRSGWTPVRMFKVLGDVLDGLGVRRTYCTCELVYQGGRVRSILKRLGYRQASEVWERVRAQGESN